MSLQIKQIQATQRLAKHLFKVRNQYQLLILYSWRFNALNYTVSIVIESALGFIVSFVREAQSQKAQKNRRKSKEEVLIWDDETIKNLVGDRSDCIW